MRLKAVLDRDRLVHKIISFDLINSLLLSDTRYSQHISATNEIVLVIMGYRVKEITDDLKDWYHSKKVLNLQRLSLPVDKDKLHEVSCDIYAELKMKFLIRS